MRRGEGRERREEERDKDAKRSSTFAQRAAQVCVHRQRGPKNECTLKQHQNTPSIKCKMQMDGNCKIESRSRIGVMEECEGRERWAIKFLPVSHEITRRDLDGDYTPPQEASFGRWRRNRYLGHTSQFGPRGREGGCEQYLGGSDGERVFKQMIFDWRKKGKPKAFIEGHRKHVVACLETVSTTHALQPCLHPRRAPI